jgi:hypothetical protein
MRNLIRRYVKGEAGSLTTTFAFTAPALAGAIALGIDAGRAELAHRAAIRAAESAAVSAAVAYVSNNSNDLTLEATAIAAKYGFTADNGSTVTVNRPPTSGSSMTNPGAVEVIITQPQPSRFAAVVWPGALSVTGRAVAVGGEKACIIALDPTASGAVGEQGNVTATATNCSVYSNSSDSASVSSGGTAYLSALSVNATGGVYGTSNITTQDGIFTSQPRIQDPYLNVNMPSYTPCTSSGTTKYQSTVTIYPGVYCGNVNVNAGAVVTLSPGTYIFDKGSLSIAGGATFQGSGVTLVFTSSDSATVAGGATVSLTPPTSGTYQGISIYASRSMSTGTVFKLAGGSSQSISGAIYLPKAQLSYAGNTGMNVTCTQIVADTVNFVGNSTLGLTCPWGGTRYGGAPRIME